MNAICNRGEMGGGGHRRHLRRRGSRQQRMGAPPARYYGAAARRDRDSHQTQGSHRNRNLINRRVGWTV
jgi:hypothetical protein